MKNRHIAAVIVTTAVLLLSSVSLSAQGTRKVQGCVYDEDGTALTSVTIRVDDSELEFVTDENGHFEGEVGIYNEFLTAVKDGYKSKKLAIDGTYLVFRLKHALTAEEMKTIAEQQALKKEERMRKDEEYGRKYKNRGLVHSVELSYVYQHNTLFYVGYENGDEQEFDSLNPLSLTYACNWRFSRFVQAGLGVGCLFNLTHPDKDIEGGKRHKDFDIPLFANVKSAFFRSKFQPMVSFSIGVYPVHKNALLEIGGGCNFRIDRNKSVYLLLTYGDTPGYWYYYNGKGYGNNYGIFSDWTSVGFRAGFSF